MNARRWRQIRLVIPLLLGAALVAVSAADETQHPISADKKIAFYRARIGGPSTYPAHARLGVAYLQKFRETDKSKYYEQGILHLRKSLGYQQNYEALLGLAVGLSERHYFNEALPHAEEAVAAMPSDPEAAGVLFDIQLALGKTAEAEKGLNSMLDAKAGFHSLARLAALREYRGDLTGALDAMTKARDDAARNQPGATAWAEVRLGSLHVALCDAAQARKAYDRALAIEPGSTFASEHLAEWHAAQGQWQEAETLFRRLLKSHPEPQYRIALAEALQQQGEHRAAKQQRTKAVGELRRAARDGAQDAFRPLALLLLENQETAAEGLSCAAQDWKVRQDALSADTLAWAHHCNGQGSEALRLSEQALASEGKNPALRIHGGMIRYQAGHKTEGRLILEQALSCPLAFGPHERMLETAAKKVSADH